MTDIYSRLVVFALAFSLCASAQQVQPPRRNTYRANAGGTTAAPRLVSPEVHPDRTITFRLRAPKASEVALSFPGSPRPMTKDGDGVWSVTIGPVAPEVYEYAFTVDGVRVPDTANSEVATGKGLPGSHRNPGCLPQGRRIEQAHRAVTPVGHGQRLAIGREGHSCCNRRDAGSSRLTERSPQLVTASVLPSGEKATPAATGFSELRQYALGSSADAPGPQRGTPGCASNAVVVDH
jgi:hypothetical protein